MRSVSFTLNGTPTRVTVDETRTLLWVLRDNAGNVIKELQLIYNKARQASITK